MAVLTPAFLPAVVVVPIPTECLFNEDVPFKVFTCEKVAIPLELTLELPNAVLIPVKFEPSIAGKAPDNFDAVSDDILASATVPVRLPAGKSVRPYPSPLKEFAVTIPTTTTP